MNTAFLEARITATKAAIEAAETAEALILGGAMSQYTLDTGQTRQTVTKLNISELRRGIDSLYNRLATLEARLYGNGTFIMGPST